MGLVWPARRTVCEWTVDDGMKHESMDEADDGRLNWWVLWVPGKRIERLGWVGVQMDASGSGAGQDLCLI